MEAENFTHLAIAWRAEMSNKLRNAEIDHVSNRGFKNDKNIWDPNLVMTERHKMGHQTRIHQIKFLRLPKESVSVEARKVIRKENSEILRHAKEERMVKRAIHNLEKSFSDYRNFTEFSVMEYVRLNKRKENARFAKNTNAFDKSKQTESENFLKNFQKIYNNIHCQVPNIKNQNEGIMCCRGFHKSDKNLKNSGDKNLGTDCRIFPDGGDLINLKNFEMKNDGNKVIRPESAESGPCSCRYNEEQKKLYPSPKELTGNSEKETALQNWEESKTSIIFSFSYKFLLLRYWKAWRKFVVRTRIDKEKLTRINKINSFLKRLTETVLNDNTTASKNLKLCAVRNSNQKARKPSRKKSVKPIPLMEMDEHLDRIEDELNKSSVEAYEHLRRGIKNFHPKLRPKAKVLSVLTKIDKASHRTEMKRNYPIPSILVRMENRYKERKKRWEDIERRKREIQLEKEEIEKERQKEKIKIEALQKREKLEELMKKRLERKKAEEERHMRKEELKKKIRLAQEHYKKYVTKRIGFQPWKNLVLTRCTQLKEADGHFQIQTLKLYLKHWRNQTLLEIEQKCGKADKMYNHILLKRSFTLLVKVYIETVKKLQVALDWWDAKLTEKIFKLWLEYIQNERLNSLQKEEIANFNYSRIIAKKYFKKWKKFPEYKRYENEREIRKRLLQCKVKEFLPDYQPAYVSKI